MSGEPPVGAQVSPDGKWWWNGTNWVLMPGVDSDAPSALQSATQPSVRYQQVASTYPQSVFVYGPRTNSSAVASLVFGIISWFLCPFIGGVLAVIFGHTARGQIRRTGESGSGLATAGLVLGYIHLVAALLFFGFWILLLGGTTAMLGVIGHLASPTP